MSRICILLALVIASALLSHPNTAFPQEQMHELGAGVNNNWIVAPVINQNIEENVTFQFDHFNAVLLSCSIFA